MSSRFILSSASEVLLPDTTCLVLVFLHCLDLRDGHSPLLVCNSGDLSSGPAVLVLQWTWGNSFNI